MGTVSMIVSSGGSHWRWAVTRTSTALPSTVIFILQTRAGTRLSISVLIGTAGDLGGVFGGAQVGCELFDLVGCDVQVGGDESGCGHDQGFDTAAERGDQRGERVIAAADDETAEPGADVGRDCAEEKLVSSVFAPRAQGPVSHFDQVEREHLHERRVGGDHEAVAGAPGSCLQVGVEDRPDPVGTPRSRLSDQILDVDEVKGPVEVA